MAIPDDVKAAAREAVEPMQGMVIGSKDVDISSAQRSNAYENQPENTRGADSFDTQLAQAVAQEKAMERSIEHERGIEHGREM